MNWRNLIPSMQSSTMLRVGMVAALLIVALAVWGLMGKLHNMLPPWLGGPAEPQTELVLPPPPEPERVLDNKGRETATTQTITLTKAELKNLIDTNLRGVIDELHRAEGRQAHLFSNTYLATTTSGTLQAHVRDTLVVIQKPNGDTASVIAPTFAYRDPWIQIRGSIVDSTAYVKYSLRDRFNITGYSKRDRWWKFWQRRKAYTQVKSLNPNTRTDTTYTVELERR